MLVAACRNSQLILIFVCLVPLLTMASMMSHILLTHFSLLIFSANAAPAGAVCAPLAMHAEACTISIQLFDTAISTPLILSDVVLTAKDKSVMEYSTLIAKLSTTRFWVGNCFDNNSTTRWVSCSSRR